MPSRNPIVFYRELPIAPLAIAAAGGKAMKLRLGIPKGSLQEATLHLFARAGLRVYTNGALVFRLHGGSGYRMHADSRTGDGALRGTRRPGRRTHRH